MTYSDMVVEAIQQLNDKNGSTIISIRKYIQNNFEYTRAQVSSFNKLTMNALQKEVATGVLERVTKHNYRISNAEKERRKEESKNKKKLEKDKERDKLIAANARDKEKKKKERNRLLKLKGMDIDDDDEDDPSLIGTAAQHNKSMRKEFIAAREKRDKYIKNRIELLLPFITEKNYFSRKEKKEQDMAKQREREKLEKKAISDAKSLASRQTTDITDILTNLLNHHMQLQNLGNEVESDLNYVRDSVRNIISYAPINYKSKLSQIILDEEVEEVEEQSKQEKIEIPTSASSSSSSSNMEIDEVDAADVPEEEILAYAMKGVEIIEQPPILVAELHDHQIQGISWMVHMFKNGMPMMLGDQMGLGKTIQTIGFLAYLQHFMNKRGPHLIVVPLSVLSNWMAEIERFCPTFRAIRFHGPKDERDRIKSEEIDNLKEFDIVVTTYEMLVSEVNWFKRKYVWTSIVVDEGHRLKNERSQLAEKLRTVPSLTKIILTGTPLQNNLRELWALLHYLVPDIFTPSTGEAFEEGFDLHRGFINSAMLRRARKLLGVFMLRRIKDKVNIKLPSRREVTVLVPLTKNQVDWYEQLLCGLDSDTIETVMRESTKPITSNSSSQNSLQALATTNSSQSNGKSSSKKRKQEDDHEVEKKASDSDWRKLMNLLLQLRKICNHIYLMPDAAPEPYEITEAIVQGSGKLKMLDRMLPKLQQDGHRVLIFSQFTSMLDLLEDYCELREHNFVRLDGDTNRVQRRLDVRRFNAPNSPIFIFLISTRAGGLGLNLASADTVILYDSDWNPQVDLQAMERAHRIGQTKPVRVYRLICRGSVEERMISRAEKKLFLNAMVAEVDPDEETTEDNIRGEAEAENDVNSALGIGGTSMSKTELASLIRFGANAVVESSNSYESEMPDEELDKLLERTGRSDEPIKNDKISNESNSVDAVEEAQQILRDRLEKLEEVDLRQLGDKIYKKKKVKTDTKSLNFLLGENNEMSDKRVSKQRITMVDGKGTGYGGAVPVLNDSMEKGAAPVQEKLRSRGRDWCHHEFCVFCAKRKQPETFVKCAHCPNIFHQACMNRFGVTRQGGNFICPHHRCAICNRNTASAGGLLFRCTGCLTSYCEDCLPQDEIDSVGRCRVMLDLGYDSTQSYYIKCPTCVIAEGRVPLGVDGSIQPEKKIQRIESFASNSSKDTSDIKDDEALLDEEPEEERVLLLTQTQRILWEELPDSEEEREKAREKLRKKKKGKKSGNKAIRNKRKGASNDDDSDDDEKVSTKGKKTDKASPKKNSKNNKKNVDSDDNDEEEEEEEEEELDEIDILCSKVNVPKKISLSKALDLILVQDQASCLQKNLSKIWNDKQLKNLSSINVVREKIDNGRFRSAMSFLTEVRSVLEGISKLPVSKSDNSSDAHKIVNDAALLLGLFNRKISNSIVL